MWLDLTGRNLPKKTDVLSGNPSRAQCGLQRVVNLLSSCVVAHHAGCLCIVILDFYVEQACSICLLRVMVGLQATSWCQAHMHSSWRTQTSRSKTFPPLTLCDHIRLHCFDSTAQAGLENPLVWLNVRVFGHVWTHMCICMCANINIHQDCDYMFARITM